MYINEETKAIFNKASSKSYWRGYYYFRDGLVKDIKRIDDETFEGIVKGSNEYKVSINLNHPKQCSCTCPFVEGNKKICKHMIALAFAVDKGEAKRAKKIIDDEEKEERYKEQLLEERMKPIRNRYREYVSSLTLNELREELYRRLVNEEYDHEYEAIYGNDDEWW